MAESRAQDRQTETPEAHLWGLGVAIAVVAHVAVSTVYTSLIDWAEGTSHRLDLLASAICASLVVVMVVVLWRARGESRTRRPFRVSVARAWPWIVASAAALTTLATGTAVDEWVAGIRAGEHVPRCEYVLGSAFGIAAIGFTSLLFHYRHAFGARTQYPKQALAEERRCLVLFVSLLVDSDRVKYTNGIPDWYERELETTLAQEIEKVTLEKVKKPFWSWEMLLRAIHHHIGTLDRIVLVCSPQSIRQVDHFLAILKTFQETRDLTIVVWARNAVARHDERGQGMEPWTGFDFENLNELSRALGSLLNRLRAQGVEDDQIMLDFTGGQKTSSVVCACMTFNRDLRAQYVQTNPPHAVISYDLSVESDRPLAG